MIRTIEYALTKKDYLKILVLLRLRSSWLSYLFIIAVTLFFLPKFSSDPVARFLVIFTPLYILFIFLYLVYFVNTKDNRNIYRKHQLTFNEVKVTAYSGKDTVFDTPTTSEIANSQIIKTKKVAGYWLLYIVKNSFVVVPETVFTSKEDLEGFKKLYKLQ